MLNYIMRSFAKISKKYTIAFCLLFFVSSGVLMADPSFAPPSVNLDQCRNGTDAAPTNPINWVNGNANGSQAHYLEGMSIPYRCVLSNVFSGTQYTLTIGFDVRNGSKNAIDYLTHYNRLTPHYFTIHATAETINPLTGTGLSSAPYTTYAIPAPSSSGSSVSGMPGTSFSTLPAAERLMTMYNGTIDTIYYLSQGSLSASTSETQMVIKVTPSASTAVIIWGGHIASRTDWGYVSGSPQSAGGISGSPFHMRLKAWSGGSAGSQDRSLSGDAIGGPVLLPVELLSFEGHAKEENNELLWVTASEINSDYFSVEKSMDGINFQRTGIVKAAGNSTVPLYYRFTDTSPFFKTTYYRLVEIDYDGTPNTYGTIVVANKNYHASKLTIYNLQGIAMMTIENPSEAIPAGLPVGFYLFYYTGNKGIVTKKVFIGSAQGE